MAAAEAVSTTVAVLPAKIFGGVPKYLATLATTKDMLSSRLFEKARHRPGMKLIESNLSL
jgi:hypothetical protein